MLGSRTAVFWRLFLTQPRYHEYMIFIRSHHILLATAAVFLLVLFVLSLLLWLMDSRLSPKRIVAELVRSVRCEPRIRWMTFRLLAVLAPRTLSF